MSKGVVRRDTSAWGRGGRGLRDGGCHQSVNLIVDIKERLIDAKRQHGLSVPDITSMDYRKKTKCWDCQTS